MIMGAVFRGDRGASPVVQLFVRDGIHSDADYNSSRVGVGVVVVPISKWDISKTL